MSRIINRSAEVQAAARVTAAGLLREFCAAMADGVRTRTPWDTGHNSRSIAHEVSGLTGKIYSESGYGGWLEIGTAKMRARPYFAPAYEEAMRDLK